MAAHQSENVLIKILIRKSMAFSDYNVCVFLYFFFAYTPKSHIRTCDGENGIDVFMLLKNDFGFN